MFSSKASLSLAMPWGPAIVLHLIPIHFLSGQFLCNELVESVRPRCPLSFYGSANCGWTSLCVCSGWADHSPSNFRCHGWADVGSSLHWNSRISTLLLGLAGTQAHLNVSVWSLLKNITCKAACKIYTGGGIVTIRCTFLGLCTPCTCFYFQFVLFLLNSYTIHVSYCWLVYYYLLCIAFNFYWSATINLDTLFHKMYLPIQCPRRCFSRFIW